jgi:hypothetical protein
MKELLIRVVKVLLSILPPVEKWRPNKVHHTTVMVHILAMNDDCKLKLFKSLAFNLSKEDRKALLEILSLKKS